MLAVKGGGAGGAVVLLKVAPAVDGGVSGAEEAKDRLRSAIPVSQVVPLPLLRLAEVADDLVGDLKGGLPIEPRLEVVVLPDVEDLGHLGEVEGGIDRYAAVADHLVGVEGAEAGAEDDVRPELGAEGAEVGERLKGVLRDVGCLHTPVGETPPEAPHGGGAGAGLEAVEVDQCFHHPRHQSSGVM